MTGAEIRAGRALVGWTQKELATAAGVHPNSVKAWEPRETAAGEAVDAIRTALERQGVRFGGGGVQLVEAA